MPTFIHSREELEHLLVTMHADGWSKRGLSRHFSISRNMVRRILRKHQDHRDNGADILNEQKIRRAARASKLDPFTEQIKQLLEKFQKITGQRIFEELKDAGYTGGISILRERLKKMRPTPKRTPIIRFETDPGVQGQMDWSPYVIPFVKDGKVKVQCFSYILTYSRRHYVDFTRRRDCFSLIRRHQDAFGHFSGIPAQCLYDSEKTIVLRWEAGKPIFNPSFAAFITHYNCKPIICQRGRPQTKGKIESPFKYVMNNLLNGREFQDLEDLKTFARWWLRNRSDIHIHDTTKRAPIELFLEQELDALQSLQKHPYDSAEVALRVCDLEGYLEFETNRYPAPYEYVADILTMKITDHEVLIFSPDLALIVRHEKLTAGACVKLDAQHIHGAQQVRYGLEPVRDQFIAIGEEARQFLKGLKDKQSNPGFHARYILRLKESYHCDDINKALEHACRYHAYDCKAIERILAVKAKLRTLESIRNDRASEELRQKLPEIKQRSLEEYSTLFKESNNEHTAKDGGQSEQYQVVPENFET